MIVEIKKDIFKGHDFKSLNHLISILTYKQRYHLFVEISLINSYDDYKKLDIDVRQEIGALYNKVILEGTEPEYFISDTGNNNFNSEEAIRFFNQPVSIVLENSLNDQYFVEAIIKCFNDSGVIKEHIKNGWIQFDNAGGCTNVENFINAKLIAFTDLSSENNKNNYSYLRCFVLLDSDKEHPNAEIKPAYKKLLDFFGDNNITSHILEKRCMENYMPDEVFRYIANTQELKDWFLVYAKLSDDEKDYLNINGGFSKKNQDLTPKNQRRDLEEAIQKLYSELSNANYKILDKGFNLAHFKTDFPKNFSHHQVYKSNLQQRCNSNELQEIVDKIAILL